MNHLIILTGGPGTGKTSVIHRLNRLGYLSVPETGRRIIQQQVACRGHALPWDDKVAFRDEMMREELAHYQAYVKSKELVFFDRSLIDVYGYSKLECLPISKSLHTYCHTQKYCQNVFIFPPWASIFINDQERKQNFDEAVATYQEMVKAYNQFGYRLIEVPKVSVGERVQFMLHFLNK
ncbi:AAA family ATPase [Celerinatantimonas sp. YJH-8]|uniref:AAA family ATPase n=1 Tax=Celerinatantimonas sp. YJH-8 TaxID=3228714 RepID=UPI0038C0346C